MPHTNIQSNPIQSHLLSDCKFAFPMLLCQCVRPVCFGIMSMFTLVYKINNVLFSVFRTAEHAFTLLRIASTNTSPELLCVVSERVNYSGFNIENHRQYPNRMVTRLHAILFPFPISKHVFKVFKVLLQRINTHPPKGAEQFYWESSAFHQ